MNATGSVGHRGGNFRSSTQTDWTRLTNDSRGWFKFKGDSLSFRTGQGLVHVQLVTVMARHFFSCLKNLPTNDLDEKVWVRETMCIVGVL